ncbi:MAG: transposase [Deltaproteobacteria bacterium]|nr:transposase [Deltaproteobacteria bacterium]
MEGDVAIRLRQIVRDICAELEVEIIKVHIGKDHVHMFVSNPPHVSFSINIYLSPFILKGRYP